MSRFRAWMLLPLPFMLWTGWFLAHGSHRWDYLALFFGIPLLVFAHEKTRKWVVLLYPIGLVGILYEGTSFVRNLGVSQERVHLCDLRDFDARLFGVTLDTGQRVSLPEFLHLHPSPILDAICAIPYGTFIYAIMIFGTYLAFRDEAACKRFMWTFLLMNVAGFVTYHVFPAAPPWYFGEHGCTVDLTAVPNEGPNLAAVDARLGIHYFHAFYGRGAEVYGAMPSLHVAYPGLIVLEIWKRGKIARGIALTYWAMMVFAAPYLFHHWVVDVIAGLLYAAAIYLFVRWVVAKTSQAPAPHEVPVEQPEREPAQPAL